MEATTVGWAGIVVLVTLALYCPTAAAGNATGDQLKEMTASFQSFVNAIAAHDGKHAVDFVTEHYMDQYVVARDEALNASEEELRKNLGSVLGVMEFRMNFTADEIEGKSAREIYVALVEKGLAGTKAAARFLSDADVTDADIGDVLGSPRAHPTLTMKGHAMPQAMTVVYEGGRWRTEEIPFELALSDYLPRCFWSLAETGVDPENDSSCSAEIAKTMKPFNEYFSAVEEMAINRYSLAEEEFTRLHQPADFEALMHHRFDPRYWQPMRPIGAQ